MEKNIRQDSDSKTAKYFNKLSNSKTPFLDEILKSIKQQSERGLFRYQVDYYRVTDKTLSELRNMGFNIYKGGVDNSNYIIDWEFKTGAPINDAPLAAGHVKIHKD